MQTYRLYRRGEGAYYLQHTTTLKRISLKTKDPAEAKRLHAAHNETERVPAVNRQIGMAYICAADPAMGHRTWAHVMETYSQRCHGPTLKRILMAIKDPAYDLIRHQRIVETTGEQFLRVLNAGGVSTNMFLRQFHNLAVDLDWLPKRVLAKKLWPRPHHKHARSITSEEHQRIIERESNLERKLYYELLWETGMSQTDAAMLESRQIDWTRKLMFGRRQKLKSKNQGDTSIKIGACLAAVLEQLPKCGSLFPYLRTVREIDRATEFSQRCAGLHIYGITLRSYRTAWAERAAAAGYPQRFAMAHLGHGSKIVHQMYAAGASVACPSLEEVEQLQKEGKILLYQAA